MLASILIDLAVSMKRLIFLTIAFSLAACDRAPQDNPEKAPPPLTPTPRVELKAISRGAIVVEDGLLRVNLILRDGGVFFEPLMDSQILDFDGTLNPWVPNLLRQVHVRTLEINTVDPGLGAQSAEYIAAEIRKLGYLVVIR